MCSLQKGQIHYSYFLVFFNSWSAALLDSISEFLYEDTYIDWSSDFYAIDGLKVAATRAFSLTFFHTYFAAKSPSPAPDGAKMVGIDFPGYSEAVRRVYSSTLEPDRGLRDVVVHDTLRCIGHLIDYKDFKDLIFDVPQFSNDLFTGMSKTLKDKVRECKKCNKQQVSEGRYCATCGGRLSDAWYRVQIDEAQ